DLLAVAFGVGGNPALEIEFEQAGQFIDIMHVDGLSPQSGEELHRLPATHVGVEVQVSGQVSNDGADLLRLPLAIESENRGPARGRPDQVDQEANGSRLPRPVRPEKAEDLARHHIEIELIERPEIAV